MGEDETVPTSPFPSGDEARQSGAIGHPSFGSPARRWAVLGALSAAALVGAAFVLAHRSEPAPDVDPRIERALLTAAVRGAAPGAWQIQESHGETRKRTFAEDPNHPSRVLCRFDDATGRPVLSFPRDQVARKMFGDIELFLRNYRLAFRGTQETLDGRATVRFQWTSSLSASTGSGGSGGSGGAGGSGGSGTSEGAAGSSIPGAARTVWMDDASGLLVGLEDRAFDGALIHSARLLSQALGEMLGSPGGPADAADRTTARPAPAKGPSIEDVVRQAPFPVYEPTRLPKGFERTGVWLIRAPAAESATAWSVLNVVHLKYSDGVANIDVWVAKPDDLTRYDEWIARRGGHSGEAAACASSPSGTPEDLLADDALTIRRRVDRCRSVYLVHPVDGVSVELIGRNELPQEAYLTAVRSLERVKGGNDAVAAPAAPAPPAAPTPPPAPAAMDAK